MATALTGLAKAGQPQVKLSLMAWVHCTLSSDGSQRSASVKVLWYFATKSEQNEQARAVHWTLFAALQKQVLQPSPAGNVAGTA